MPDIFDSVNVKLRADARRSNFFGLLIVWLIVIFTVGGITYGVEAITQGHKGAYTITIDSKDRVCKGGTHGHCKYMIYATDGSVFKNTDELVWGWRWKMDSANMQASLHTGHTYRIRTVGYRIPFLSTFENIIYADEVK